MEMEIIEALIPALISGGITLLGVLISNGRSHAVTDTKLEGLMREVREQNDFVRKVPVLEEKVARAEKRIDRLEDLHRQ